VRSPTQSSLFAGAFDASGRGWVVGQNGAVLVADVPDAPLAITRFEVTVRGDNLIPIVDVVDEEPDQVSASITVDGPFSTERKRLYERSFSLHGSASWPRIDFDTSQSDTFHLTVSDGWNKPPVAATYALHLGPIVWESVRRVMGWQWPKSATDVLTVLIPMNGLAFVALYAFGLLATFVLSPARLIDLRTSWWRADCRRQSRLGAYFRSRVDPNGRLTHSWSATLSALFRSSRARRPCALDPSGGRLLSKWTELSPVIS
jgi:hypothetical protein